MARNTLVPFKRVEMGDVSEAVSKFSKVSGGDESSSPSKVEVAASDDRFTLLQNNIEKALEKLTESDIIDGRLVPGSSLDVGTNTVTHRLGRRAKGAMVVAQSGLGDVAVTGLSTSQITVEAENAVTVSFWVF